MKKGIIMFFAVLPMLVLAQNIDKLKVIEEINKSTSSISSLECQFTQNNHLKMLNDVITSKGVMYYSGGNKLRWEYISPYTYTFILNDTRAMLKKNDRQDVIDVNQNKMFKEIARIMMNSVLGKSLSDEKSFKTSIADNGKDYEATMIPVKKDMQQMFPTIKLIYNKAENMVMKVLLYQKNGDYTEILLQNIKKNSTIPDEIFSIE